MDRYDMCYTPYCGESMEERQDGEYCLYDEAQEEIQKRDARIAELESQLAACAAGPWRKPTEDDWNVLQRDVSFGKLPDDPKLITVFDEHRILEFVATVNPPESDPCAR